VRLSADNTAVVVDSTADLPDPQGRHPNWRLVPLYVRFGDETFREYLDISAEEFYRRLRSSSEPPKSSQPSPADFEAAPVRQDLGDVRERPVGGRGVR
jgi:fatty acid-binding protein DegV